MKTIAATLTLLVGLASLTHAESGSPVVDAVTAAILKHRPACNVGSHLPSRPQSATTTARIAFGSFLTAGYCCAAGAEGLEATTYCEEVSLRTSDLKADHLAFARGELRYLPDGGPAVAVSAADLAAAVTRAAERHDRQQRFGSVTIHSGFGG